MRAWQASDRWSCDHHAASSCPWCEGTDAEVWRDVSSYVPIYGIPAQPVAPVSTLAEFVDAAFPGFWERGAGGVS